MRNLILGALDTEKMKKRIVVRKGIIPEIVDDVPAPELDAVKPKKAKKAKEATYADSPEE